VAFSERGIHSTAIKRQAVRIRHAIGEVWMRKDSANTFIEWGSRKNDEYAREENGQDWAQIFLLKKRGKLPIRELQ